MVIKKKTPPASTYSLHTNVHTCVPAHTHVSTHYTHVHTEKSRSKPYLIFKTTQHSVNFVSTERPGDAMKRRDRKYLPFSLTGRTLGRGGGQSLLHDTADATEHS